MFGIKSAIGISAIGLVALASPAAAGDYGTPQSASTGNLTQPSMVAESGMYQHVVARGDTGIWHVSNKGGDFFRTRLTQDFTSKVNGQTVTHSAQSPQIAINNGGALTVVYSIKLTPGSCGSQGILYTVHDNGAWSPPKSIPNTACETATGLVVHGTKIYLATIHGTSRVSYFTNASGSWTHATVATAPHISRSSLSTYDGKPMLAYIKQGHLVYARGQTSTGSFVHETAATTGPGATSQPSVAINEISDWPMIAWAQADGTHYAYRNAQGWYSYRVMQGSVRALLEITPDGASFILSADGTGGLWFASRYPSDPWHSGQMDAHTTTDVGGMYISDNITNVSYIRAGTHLFAIVQYSGC
jgi:hypothetical protein